MIINDDNLKQAGALTGVQNVTEIPDYEVLETMLAFSRGEEYNVPNLYTPKRNVFQGGTKKNIKQAATVSDIEMLDTMLAFGGYSL